MSFLFRHKARVFSPILLMVLGGCAYIAPEQPIAPPLPALAKPAPFTAADADLAQKLNALNLAQIAAAKNARTHAGRSDIALVAATIGQDLTALQARLTKLATSHALTLTDKPSATDQKQIDQMLHLYGAAFDKRYIRYFSSADARIKPVLAKQIAASKDTDLVAIARDTQAKLATYQAQLH